MFWMSPEFPLDHISPPFFKELDITTVQELSLQGNGTILCTRRDILGMSNEMSLKVLQIFWEQYNVQNQRGGNIIAFIYSAYVPTMFSQSKQIIPL